MSQPVTRRIEDATPFHAGTDRTMAVLSLAVAVGVVFWFKLPLNFDVNSPEFNPMVFLPVVLVLYGVAQAFKSVRGRGIVNRFGASVFEMQGNAVSVGQTLRGRVVTSRDLIATSGFRLRLRCIEEVSYAQSAGSAGDRRRDVIRWEAESTVEATESGSDGVPVTTPPAT